MKKNSYILLLLITPMLTRPSQEQLQLFAHGLFDDQTQAKRYEETLVQAPLAAFNFPDAQWYGARLWKKLTNVLQTSLGQGQELETIANAYKENIHDKDTNQTPCVFIGLSRGATALWNFVAQNLQKDNPELPIPAKACLVLESPFDSAMGVVREYISNTYLLACIATLMEWGIPFFKYDPHGVHPLDNAQQIPKQWPVLLICSAQDRTVPAACTTRLAEKLKQVGHSHVYLLTLAHGKHSTLLHNKDGVLYKAVTHAFFKKYGFNHNAELADQGAATLEGCHQG